MKCEWCGLEHETKCSFVKAIEYFSSGKVKRVEFMTPADYPPLNLGAIGPTIFQPAVPGAPPGTTWIVGSMSS